jgi:hypothetical protein
VRDKLKSWAQELGGTAFACAVCPVANVLAAAIKPLVTLRSLPGMAHALLQGVGRFRRDKIPDHALISARDRQR